MGRFSAPERRRSKATSRPRAFARSQAGAAPKNTEADGGGAASPVVDIGQFTGRNIVVETVTTGVAVRSATTVNVYLAQTTAPAEAALGEAAKPDYGPNPYKGLRYFDERDAEHFFGRGDLIRERLWPRFLELCLPRPSPIGLRILPVLGPSGSGKSSVVRAGLIPELARQPIEPYGHPRVAVLTPGTRPLEALARVLARIATGEQAPAAKTREYAAELKLANQRGQHDGLRRIADGLPEIEACRLIVVVDQFEEAYVVPVGEDERKVFEVERDAFIANLIHAARDRSGHVSIVLAMRNDFFGATARHDELHQHLARHELLVPAMGRGELEAAIRQPAQRAGHALPEAVIQLLVDQTLGREGALPLLQVALQQIWEALPRDPAETLRELGGVGGALATTADQIYKDLSSDQQRIARRAFLAMVNLGEGAADTRRRAALPEMVAAGEQVEDVERVLERFSRWEVRLVSRGLEPSGRTTAELTHEALISEWGRLRGWIEQNREDLAFARRVSEAGKAWKASIGGLWQPPELDLLRRYAERHIHDLTQLQREFLDASLTKETRRRHVRRAVTGSIVVLALIAVTLGVWGLIAAEEARVAETVAERRAEEANRQRQIATARAAGVQALWLSENGLSALLTERAAVLAREGWRFFPTPDAHAAADRLVRSLPLHRIEHDGPVAAMAFDPKGRWLGTATDGTVRLINPETGQELRRIEHGARVIAMAFDPKGRWLATASYGGRDVGGWVLLIDPQTGRVLHRIDHGDWGATAVEFDPKGRWLAAVSYNGSVRLIDPNIGRVLHRIENIGRVPHWIEQDVPAPEMAIDPGGRWLAAVRNFGDDVGARVTVIDPATGRVLHRIEHGAPVTDMAFDPRGRLLVVASYGGHVGGRVFVIDPTTGHELRRFEHSAVWAVAFDPKGRWLATSTGSSPGSVRLIDIETGQELRRIEHDTPVTAMTFDPGGRWLATSAASFPASSVRVIDAETGRVMRRIAHDHPVTAIAFHGRWLATASLHVVRVIDVEASGQELRRIDHGQWVAAVAFDLQGRWLAIASHNSARLIDPLTGRVLHWIEHGAPVEAVAFDPKGRWLATGSRAGARLIDPLTGRVLHWIEHRDGDVIRAVAFDAEGRWLATASSPFDSDHANGQVMVIDPGTGRVLHRIEHGGDVTAVAFDPNGRLLAATSYGAVGGSVLVIDPATGQELRRIEHDAPVTAMAFDSGGRWLATSTGSIPGSVRVIDAQTGRVLHRIRHGDWVAAVAFDPNGRWLATASQDGSARLIDPVTGRVLHRIEHGGAVAAVAFDPKGRWLATASSDGSARLFDSDTGRELYRIEHGGPVDALAFDAKGRWLTTASGGTVRVIHADPAYAIDLLCARAGRNLSRSEWLTYLSGEPYRKSCDSWRAAEETAVSETHALEPQ